MNITLHAIEHLTFEHALVGTSKVYLCILYVKYTKVE